MQTASKTIADNGPMVIPHYVGKKQDDINQPPNSCSMRPG
jgi:hypothetical protein